MVTERYHWLWTVIESSMVMDGCLAFPMVVNGCMSSCAGSQEKNWLLRILCFCNVFNHHDLFLPVQDEWTTMRVENTITMRLPTKFTFQCRLNFNSSTGYNQIAMHNRLWFKINGPFTPYITIYHKCIVTTYTN